MAAPMVDVMLLQSSLNPNLTKKQKKKTIHNLVKIDERVVPK